MKALSSAGLACLAALGCGSPSREEPSIAPSASAAASGAPLAAASAAPLASARPGALQRTTSPEARRARDEAACDQGSAAACRRAADRYRGYGQIAGCGVRDGGRRHGRKVTALDAVPDARTYLRWTRKACAAGDDEACQSARSDVYNRGSHDGDGCLRNAPEACPLLLWQDARNPEWAKVLAGDRTRAIAAGRSWDLSIELYRRDKKRGGDALPAEVATLAEGICKTTLECDPIFMMLDENGYTEAALSPLRKTVGEALVAACLAGDCVCGEAVGYLDAADPRVGDLARLGCDDGEAEACYHLARLEEEGALIAKDVEGALTLYHAACPPVLADEALEEYSKHACDRLAQMYEEGRPLDKDVEHAFYYAGLACIHPGFEHDHKPCLRLGRYHATEFGIGKVFSRPHEIYLGISGEPVLGRECQRPSVKAICDRERRSLLGD